MAQLLLALRPEPWGRALIARQLGVHERTLRNWQRALSKPGRPEGRPPHSPDAYLRCEKAVLSVLEQDGYRLGEDEMMERLEPEKDKHPRRLVRRALQTLKASHRARLRAIARKLRLQLAPLYSDVLWSLDATHLGYQADGAKLQGQVIVDVREGGSRAASLGSPPNAQDAINLLEHAKKENGQLPLVLSIDNDYDSPALRSYLNEEGVLLLVNLPYTPEHNTWVERAMRSLKEGIRDRLDSDELRGERALALTDLVLVMRESLLDMNARRRAKRRAQGQGETTIDRSEGKLPSLRS